MTIFNNFHRLSTVSNKNQNSKRSLAWLDLAFAMAMKACFEAGAPTTYGFSRAFPMCRLGGGDVRLALVEGLGNRLRLRMRHTFWMYSRAWSAGE